MAYHVAAAVHNGMQQRSSTAGNDVQNVVLTEYWAAEISADDALHVCVCALQAGTLCLRGRSPSEVGVPQWRAAISYVPQSRVHMQGSPLSLFETACNLAAQKGRPRRNLAELIDALGLPPTVLTQPWTQLSVGW